MGVGERQRAIRAVRGQVWSPGRPSVARWEDGQRLWRAIARGASSEGAAVEAGVSQAVGSRWFRDGGGMPPILVGPALGALPLVCRAGRDRDPSRPGCERAWDLAVSAVPRRRSRGSCAGTHRHAVTRSCPERRRRSGTPSDARAARRSRSWPRTSGCASTCRIGSPERSSGRTASRCPGRTCGLAADGRVVVRIAAG